MIYSKKGKGGNLMLYSRNLKIIYVVVMIIFSFNIKSYPEDSLRVKRIDKERLMDGLRAETGKGAANSIKLSQETRVAMPGRTSSDTLTVKEVSDVIEAIKSDLERQLQRGDKDISIFGPERAKYGLMEAAPSTFGIRRDSYLSDRRRGTYWRIPKENVDKFIEWLYAQSDVIKKGKGAADSIKLSRETRVAIGRSSSDTFSVKGVSGAIKAIKSDLNRQLHDGAENISIYGYGRAEYSLMEAAPSTFGIRQDRNLSDRWGGTYWRVPKENVGRFIRWLNAQFSILPRQQREAGMQELAGIHRTDI